MPGKTGKVLTNRSRHRIRFSEVDSMGIMWHGHYVQYLEEAREAFGNEYGIGYLYVRDNGFFIPITDMQLKYRASVKYGDEIIIDTTFIDTMAAKIIFQYEIKVVDAPVTSLFAETTQVFTDTAHTLQLNIPEFFLEWKRKVGLLDE